MGCVLTSTPTWEQSHLLCSRLGTIYNKQYVGHLTPCGLEYAIIVGFISTYAISAYHH